MKSKKIKKIDEGRTWGVQTLDLCDGTNNKLQRNKNKMTEKNDSGILSKLIGGTDENLKSTVLPCTDLLLEIKAQGLYLLNSTRTDFCASEINFCLLESVKIFHFNFLFIYLFISLFFFIFLFLFYFFSC